jgi:hypothetical protein
MNKKPGKKESVRRSPVRVADEVKAEYDFSNSKANPYAARYKSGATVIVLDPDVAESFPDAQSVNAALRAIANGRREHS